VDPLTLALILGGGYLGATKVWPKVKEKIQQHQRAESVAAYQSLPLPVQLDANLSDLEKMEISNLLHNVSSPAILSAAATVYQAKNFPLASQVLAARAKALGG
jgi:hypothetical protein